MFSRLRLAALLLTVVAVPATSHAQQSHSRPAPAAAPRLDVTATAMRRMAQPADSAATQRARRQSVGRPVALMVVGGAAVVLGALIGDDVGALFMVGGAVTLLVGLYQYLQ